MGYDVVIAGGGVIGLASAYYLAEAGARVLVLERGRIGQEASWAAAGMRIWWRSMTLSTR